MELVTPSVKYKESFIEAVQEFLRDSTRNVRSARYADMPSPEELEQAFPQYVKKVNDFALGVGLPEGYIPSTELWLVDGDRYVGSISIRHQLTPHLLREGGGIGYDIRPSERKKGYGSLLLQLALPHARDLGLDKVLVTCDETNIASRKIIESNGGVFENKVSSSDGGADKLRFWIDL